MNPVEISAVITVLQLINTGLAMAGSTIPAVAQFAAELHAMVLTAKSNGQTQVAPADVAKLLTDMDTAAKAAVASMLTAPTAGVAPA